MLSFISVLYAVLFTAAADPIVHAPWGQIQGVKDVTDDWTPYNVYYAIPYALPPTGVRRFTKPVPHPGVHNHVFNASSHGSACIQSVNFGYSFGDYGNEDCLTLDVYTPVSSSHSADFPVIVFIHGGGFILGNSWLYPGGPIAARGVVLVMIQYRLGPFGFLSTGDDASRGNYGLWDQHIALQWVKKNIPSFGGDVHRITLMGESAGSASVAYQSLFEGSKGLFQRTIMQSGSATSSWAINRHPVKTAYQLAQKVGCGSGHRDHTTLLNCLRAAPANVLAKASWPVGHDPMTALTEFSFVPTVDGEFVKEDPMILTNSPKFLRHVGLHDLDCMVAVNSNEGGLLLSQSQIADKALGTTMSTALVNRTFYRDRLIPHLLDGFFGNSSSNMADMVDFELTFPDIESPVIDLQKVLDTSADPYIVVPTVGFAMAHAGMNSSKKMYMYLFDHTPTFAPHVVEGLQHGQDLIYTFGFGQEMKKVFNISSVSQDEKRISTILISLLTEFAKTGNPSPAVKSYIGSDWPQFTAANQEYLVLNRHPSVSSHPYRRRIALWTQLLPEMLKDWQVANNMASGHEKGNGLLLPNLIG